MIANRFLSQFLYGVILIDTLKRAIARRAGQIRVATRQWRNPKLTCGRERRHDSMYRVKSLHMKIVKNLSLKVCFVLCVTASNAMAVEELIDSVDFVRRKSWDMSTTAGVFMPTGIAGVRENYPFWGFMVSHPSEISQIEYGFLHGRAKQVIYYNTYISFRLDYRVADAAEGFMFLGPDLHYWRRKPSRTRSYDFQLAGGVHGGFGGYFELFPNFSLRGDMKFNIYPGKTVYFGVGFIYRFGGSKAEAQSSALQFIPVQELADLDDKLGM